MTDVEPTPEAQPVRTAADLALEKLSERLDAMEAGYKAQLKELQEANRSLWASAHPVVEQSTEPQPSSVGWDDKKAEAAFYAALGRKEEKS